jgi:hypothetical protein
LFARQYLWSLQLNVQQPQLKQIFFVDTSKHFLHCYSSM